MWEGMVDLTMALDVRSLSETPNARDPSRERPKGSRPVWKFATRGTAPTQSRAFPQDLPSKALYPPSLPRLDAPQAQSLPFLPR
jgi:hypothetical protein